MSDHDHRPLRTLDRRHLLRALAGGASLAGGAALAAEDPLLQSLIRQNREADFGQGFDSASRTILMPKSSLPTLSAATAQTTEAAIAQYETFVASGGWPTVPAAERLRLGTRHPSVPALRARLVAAGC